MEKKITFVLSEVEVETLRRASLNRSLPFDPTKTEYTEDELKHFGMVREAYTKEELIDLGFGPQKINSFDQKADSAKKLLAVEAPFGSGITKWELPIFMPPLRIHQTIFTPNTFVAPHVHPLNSQEEPGGSLRIVSSGRIFYEGREYVAGDWFFIPNGEKYSFLTDPEVETTVFYTYAFFGVDKGNRFSHPHAVKSDSYEEDLSLLENTHIQNL